MLFTLLFLHVIFVFLFAIIFLLLCAVDSRHRKRSVSRFIPDVRHAVVKLFVVIHYICFLKYKISDYMDDFQTYFVICSNKTVYLSYFKTWPIKVSQNSIKQLFYNDFQGDSKSFAFGLVYKLV